MFGLLPSLGAADLISLRLPLERAAEGYRALDRAGGAARRHRGAVRARGVVKAVRIHGVGDVRLDEVPEPGDPGPGEVLVAPAWCGLCGTDAREFFGPGGAVPVEPHPLTGVSMPVVLGHELSARVVALGRASTGRRSGRWSP